MSEIKIYENESEGVFISASRAVFLETTYEIANISSVSINETPISFKDWPAIIRGLILLVFAILINISGRILFSGALGVIGVIGPFLNS